MKSKTVLKTIGIFFIAMFMLTSCSSDDDNINNPADYSIIFDKWWYDSNDFAGNLFFHSDGGYEQVVNLLGIDIPGSGTWTWEDINTGVMKIDYTSGSTAASVWLKVSNIQENSMTVQQSVNGTDYSTEIYYVDTDE